MELQEFKSMIRRKDEYIKEIKPNMRGGHKEVLVTNLFDKEELMNKARLFATLTLIPGASIGTHQHDNEKEYFYIIKGNPTYLDGDDEIQLYEGDSTICDDGQSHSIINKTDEDVVVLACIMLK